MSADILPISAGLLISMAIRYDHSFGMEDWFGSPCPLHEKQIKLLKEVSDIYLRRGAGDPQLLEEMTGTGFYREELEGSYTNIPTKEALEFANGLVEIIEFQQVNNR